MGRIKNLLLKVQEYCRQNFSGALHARHPLVLRSQVWGGGSGRVAQCRGRKQQSNDFDKDCRQSRNIFAAGRRGAGLSTAWYQWHDMSLMPEGAALAMLSRPGPELLIEGADIDYAPLG